MPDQENPNYSDHVGTTEEDTISSGTDDNPARVNGNSGSDNITTGGGDNLAAGDMVSTEWQYIDGKWVYDFNAIQNNGGGPVREYNDYIQTGRGRDVLLGNGGHDTLHAGGGNDTVNAGTGADEAYGASGHDQINLEAGNDYAEGGLGSDTVNAGDGDDVVYGDNKEQSILKGDTEGATNMKELAQTGSWTMSTSNGVSQISQSTDTQADTEYTISVDLAANLAGGHSSGTVEVLWNGEVVDTVSVTSGVYETHEVKVTGSGDDGHLSFRAVAAEGNVNYNYDGPVVSYQEEMDFGDGPVTVNAIAPGQANLYQVINGDLKIFDVENREYIDAGVSPGFKINAIGFNMESDLIYGVAKSSGVDALGNAVSSTDIVAIDATGAAFRVGEGVHGDYVGDFDGEGNLWTFHSMLNRLSVVDVDKLDADGNPELTTFDLPNDLFTDRTYDMAYNPQDGCFYAVVSPGANGGNGKVVKIDASEVQNGGMPTFQEIEITGTLYEDGMKPGVTKGAYGAVFMDGDGNLYYGLNAGDHDLDGSTGTQGGIYQVNMDWDTGQAYSEFMAEAVSTGSNDGAMDPRSTGAFAEVDADAVVLIRNPELIPEDVSGNDALRGGAGNDEIYGNGGADTIHGGTGDDTLSGDSGNDKVLGGTGDDIASGGEGNDQLLGQDGDDTLSGGDGSDYIDGGTGDDVMDGGTGSDKLVGGDGADTLSGGAGKDKLYGGEGDDVAFGGEDNDQMLGQGGNDQLSGETGYDYLDGGAGNDTLDGGEGNDKLIGGSGDDGMSGGSGKDKLDTGSGNDIASGGDGNDKLRGEAGNDTLTGEEGYDYIDGGIGDDYLDGGEGGDKMVGGEGSDTLVGGEGNDNMWGGAWTGDNTQDVFVVAAGGGKDLVHDFEHDQDQIDLSSYGLTYDDLQGAITDRGWAVEIDLSAFDGGQAGDKLLIKSVQADDLDESNFIL